MKTYEERKLVCISTGHLTKETADILNNCKLKDYPFYGGPTPDGWFVWARQSCQDCTPVDLWTLIWWANANNYDYILLDCSGPTIESLPTYDW